MRFLYPFKGNRLFNRQALIIGAGSAGCTIVQALAEHSDGTCQIIGFVDDDPAKKGTVVDIGSADAPEYTVLGNRHALPKLISQHRINTLILAINQAVDGKLEEILTDCLELGVQIVPMHVFYEQLTGRVPLEHVDNGWYMKMPLQHPGTRAINRLTKRISDIILASLGILCWAPAFPLLALAIYLDSPGPLFYTQDRVGRGGVYLRPTSSDPWSLMLKKERLSGLRKMTRGLPASDAFSARHILTNFPSSSISSEAK